MTVLNILEDSQTFFFCFSVSTFLEPVRNITVTWNNWILEYLNSIFWQIYPVRFLDLLFCEKWGHFLATVYFWNHSNNSYDMVHLDFKISEHKETKVFIIFHSITIVHVRVFQTNYIFYQERSLGGRVTKVVFL